MSSDAAPPIAADTLITGAILVTLDAERRVIHDGAIAISGGAIAAIGKHAALADRIQARTVIDARGKLATPGFVNGHVHLTETLLRGFVPESLPFDEGLHRWTIPLYEGQTVRDQLLGARLAILAMLKTGTTCFLEAGTLIAFDEVMDNIAETGIRGRAGRWVMDRAFAPGADQRALTDQALRALDAEMTRYPADGRLIAAWPMLVGHNTNTDALWQGAKALAVQHGAGISAHMSPVADDTAWYLAETGRRPVEHLAELDVLGPHLNLVHMVHVADSELALLASSGTHVTHCPAAALKGGYGAGPVGRFPEMAGAGVNLMLGTDGADTHDLMRMATLAAGLFKDARRDTAIFPAHRVLEMATRNGARAMGLDDRIGSLEVGKRADIVLHDLDRPEWRPLHNPVNQLVWSADGRGVHSVWVDGRLVIDAGRCTTIDEDALYAEAQSAADALIERSGLPAIGPWPVI